MINELSAWAQQSVGSRLERVEAKIYADAERLHFDRPNVVWFQFSAAQGVAFFCHSNGETLSWSTSSLSEVDLGEYGKELVIDLANRPPWSHLIGRMLTGIQAIVSPDGFSVGYEFLFEKDKCVLLLNLGDEIVVFDEPPIRIFAEESFFRKELA
ncbi:hypothetical protein I6F07_16855 [Ensifer sp. IC4062]|nr:hypothetical protein [Ensifer sp. IC4062]MCA1441856.1 hypothetical protein [Ensifer sp. IC4062]